ncbi:aspartyl/glutamyl-tRNA(Asn/Gln) amidotransferase subunit B-like [Physella acuta]|uniref:aspartyl/glutamyl-tRNA(Asn/Gln) amidotransferase subunit B-like n=1 Tax=Physella acuta TaxID=109671 RepID=UPI0027DC3565|nr:aspartyl/glutamyl-tRNA(Asn/Gln) amidotransferase subunit B-like [Physella acuta]
MAATTAKHYFSKQCTFCLTSHLFHHNSKRVLLAKRFKSISTKETASPIQRKESTAWKGVIGLEIHAQIASASKLFSGAGTHYGANTNSQVAFFDAALPGTLPVLNKKCVEAGVVTALALGCDINLISKFDRKHYFYADMPAGYQITQYRKPFAVNGQVTYVFQCSKTSSVERRSAKLVQIQLEQDSGKSLHDPQGGLSLIDLNRAGIGLMEIVTAPDFVNGDDASSFVRDLRDILVTVGSCDGKMAEGSLRVDANISVHKPGEPLGTRTEVKNLNSLKSIRLAIDYEVRRQIQILESGGVIENETRSFDVEDNETVPMREKEKILDYRFMPEPNLPPLVIHKDWSTTVATRNAVVLEDIRSRVKDLPDDKRRCLEEQYQITLRNAVIIVRANLFDLFERLVNKHGCDPKVTSSVLRNVYSVFLNKLGVEATSSPITDNILSEVIELCQNRKISEASVTEILDEIVKNPDASCSDIINKKDLWMITDETVINAVIDEVCGKNPSAIKGYKKGKTNQLEILSEKVKKKLKKKVSTAIVYRLLKMKLDDK